MSPTVAGDGLTASDEYTVLVAVNNPQNAEQLMRTAVDLAVANDGRVHVVSVVHKHHTSPFLLFEDEYIREEFSGDRKRLLERATDVAVEADVPVADSLLAVRRGVRFLAGQFGERRREPSNDPLAGGLVAVDPADDRDSCRPRRPTVDDLHTVCSTATR